MIKNFSQEKGYCDKVLLIEKLEEFLNDEDVVKVVKILDNICCQCFNRFKPCHCDNDE